MGQKQGNAAQSEPGPVRDGRKLTTDDGHALAQALADGWPLKRVARRFGLSVNYVCKLSAGIKRPEIRRLADTLAAESAATVVRRAQRDALSAYMRLRDIALGTIKTSARVQYRACIDLLQLALSRCRPEAAAGMLAGPAVDLAAFVAVLRTDSDG